MTSPAPPRGKSPPAFFDVRILRQDAPRQPSYWETHQVAYEINMNVISVLQQIAATARTADGKAVAPVAWECNCLEEVCGACTMVINGRVRQACTALVDRLLEERPSIELQPMVKFPVIRDLVVDRSRLFHSLLKVRAWLPVDGYYDQGHGPLQARHEQEQGYPLSKCMTCGCCVDACPQFLKAELTPEEGETAEEFEARKQAVYDRMFMGAHAIGQAVMFNTHPTGRHTTDERLDALMAEGGLQNCGNAQNCAAMCPKQIPLTTAIARAGRAVTLHTVRKWFDR